MPWKRVPIVSTGIRSRVTAMVAPNVTTMAPGMRLAYLRQKIMMAMEKMASAVAGMEMVFQAAPKASMRWKKSPGTWSMRRPKKSRI